MKFVALKSFQPISEDGWKEIPTKDIPSKYKVYFEKLVHRYLACTLLYMLFL